jgi:hypothetical protein
MKAQICRHFVSNVWATGLGHEVIPASGQATQTGLFAGTLIDGSDGTRTRDLRRDRPAIGSRVVLEFRGESAMAPPRLVVSVRLSVVRVMTAAPHRTGNPCSGATSYYPMGM